MGADYTASESQQYRDAFGTVRAAKNWFWWLILISVLVQLGGFAAVRFGGVIDDAPIVKHLLSDGAAAGPATTKPAEVADEHDGTVSAEVWYETLAWVFPATKFIATVSGLLLLLVMQLAVAISLVGRSGGAGKFASAFFWSLLLWVLLIPWQQVGTFRSTFACGALWNLQELVKHTAEVTWGAKDVPLLTQIFYYARFVAYPALAILVAIIVQVRFARGWLQTLAALSPVGSSSDTVKM